MNALQQKMSGSRKHSGIHAKLGNYNAPVRRMGFYNDAVRKLGHYNQSGSGGQSNSAMEMYPHYSNY